MQPSLTIIGTYFQVKRPMANGLAMTGSPVILSTLAPLNQFLFDSFGWRGSFLILGSIVLNCCVAGALMRPVNKSIPRKTIDESSKRESEAQEHAAAEDTTTHSDNLQTEDQSESKGHSFVQKFIDLSLFRHRGFLIYLIGNVVLFFGFFAPVVFMAPYAKHQGIDEYSAAFLLSIFALADMFIRPTTGLVGNTKWIRPRIQYFFSFAVSYNGVCHLMCPLASGYTGLVVYAVFFGLAFGMLSALLFEVLMDLVGAPRFSTAVGLVTIIECGPVLLGPPMAGLWCFFFFSFFPLNCDFDYTHKQSIEISKMELLTDYVCSLSGALVDYFGDYKYIYYACGVFMLVSGIFFFVMHYYNYKKLDEERGKSKAMETRNSDEAVQLKMNQADRTMNETDE